MYNRRKKEIVEGRKYKLFFEDYQIIYFVKENGRFNIYSHPEEWGRNYSYDRLWDDETYLNIKRMWTKDLFNYENRCIVMLEKLDGQGVLMDLRKREIILEGFQYSDYIGCRKLTMYNDDEDDLLLRFNNKREKEYSIFSILKGYIFEPHKYIRIVDRCCGVILDDDFAVYDDGFIMDIRGYEWNGDFLYNKEKDDYLLEVNDEESMFCYMDKEVSEDGTLILVRSVDEDEKYIEKYNTKTGRWTTEKNPSYIDYHEVDWSDYNDVVYEGHSRLELGLD